MDDIGSYSLCSRLQASKPFSFSRISDNSVRCVGCEGTQDEQFSNKVVDVLDLIFASLVPVNLDVRTMVSPTL